MSKADYINPDYKPEFERNLGTIVLTTDGKGCYCKHRRTFAADVIVSLGSRDDVSRDPDGKIEYVHGDFEIHWREDQPVDWSDHPYTDEQVERQVNTLLGMLGIPGRVDWSEAGRQSPYHGDFDADDAIFFHCFPEAFA